MLFCSRMLVLYFIIVSSFFNAAIGIDNIGEGSWIIEWHPHTATDYLNMTGSSVVPMKTDKNEQYHCVIVDEQTDKSVQGGLRSGSPWKQLRKLFDQSPCSYKVESFWTYELCHGRSVRQWHAEAGKTTLDFSLGLYSASQLQRDEAAYDEKVRANPDYKPPRLQNRDNKPSYLEVVYDGGSVCDVTGATRSAHVRYVCDESVGVARIASLREVELCHYRIVVLSPILCLLPDYRNAPVVERPIHCVARDAATPRQPAALPISLSDPLTLQHKLPAVTVGNSLSRPNSAPRQQSATPAATARSTTSFSGDNNATPDVPAKLTHQPPSVGHQPGPGGASVSGGSGGVTGSTRITQHTSALYDQALVDRILDGSHCLQGGSGWWSYEFCHGRHVTQYHINTDRSRASIQLGVFNRSAHLAWIERRLSHKMAAKNSHASSTNDHTSIASDHASTATDHALTATGQHGGVPVRGGGSGGGGRGRQVSHLYTGGDRCESAGGVPRQVEVRLRCQPQPQPSNAVTMYLLEPRTCRYVLTVEAALLCPLIEAAHPSTDLFPASLSQPSPTLAL